MALASGMVCACRWAKKAGLGRFDHRRLEGEQKAGRNEPKKWSSMISSPILRPSMPCQTHCLIARRRFSATAGLDLLGLRNLCWRRDAARHGRTGRAADKEPPSKTESLERQMARSRRAETKPSVRESVLEAFQVRTRSMTRALALAACRRPARNGVPTSTCCSARAHFRLKDRAAPDGCPRSP